VFIPNAQRLQQRIVGRLVFGFDKRIHELIDHLLELSDATDKGLEDPRLRGVVADAANSR
jgi:hypothetical protein